MMFIFLNSDGGDGDTQLINYPFQGDNEKKIENEYIIICTIFSIQIFLLLITNLLFFFSPCVYGPLDILRKKVKNHCVNC